MRLFIIAFLISTTAYAQQSTVTVTIDGQEQNVRSKAGFVKIEDEAKALTLQISVPIPDGTKAIAATGDGITFKPQWQKSTGQATFGLGGFNNEIMLKLDNGQTLKVNATVKLSKTFLKEEGCKDAGIKVAGKNLDKVALFIGVKCEKTTDRTLLHISVPQELEWQATNVFEVSGKGERWKVYDLSQIGVQGAGSQLATFNFSWNNENFVLTLMQTKGQKTQANQEVKEPLVAIRSGLGGANVSYTTPNLSGGGVAPLLYIDALTKAYWWKMKARTAVQFAMPLTGQKFYEFSFATGPSWNFGNEANPSSFTALVEYLAIGQEESEKSVSFSHSQFGIDLIYKIALSNSSISLAGAYNGLGGESTHMSFHFYYDYALENKRAWGLLVGYEMQSATDIKTSEVSTFSQILGAVTYSF